MKVNLKDCDCVLVVDSNEYTIEQLESLLEQKVKLAFDNDFVECRILTSEVNAQKIVLHVRCE